MSLKYLNKGFSRGETSFLQLTLVSLAAGSSHPMDEACHLYSSFSQELKKYIMDVISFQMFCVTSPCHSSAEAL